MPLKERQKGDKMVTIGVRIKESQHINIINKLAGRKLSDILRAFISAWLHDEIDVVWEDGEFKVKK